MTHEHIYKKLISAKKIAIFALVVILGIIFLSYSKRSISLELGVIGSMITFIYAFYLNSIFKFIEAKYENFKSHSANLSASIQSLYNLAILSGNKALKDDLQNKLIAFSQSFEDLKPEKYQENQTAINEIYKSMLLYKIKKPADRNIHTRMLSSIEKISASREQLELSGNRYLIGETKFLFILLSFFLAAMTIFLTYQSPFLLLIGIVLIVVIFFTYVLFKNVDNLTYGNYIYSKRNFDALVKFIKDN